MASRDGRMSRSSLGPQTLSTKETAASFGFGSSDRATWSKVFSTKEHAKADYGKTSPGPVYDAKSSLGVQYTSEKGTLPLFSFGTADRFARSTARSKSAMVPGPGAYTAASALGKQQVSQRATSPDIKFGSSTRDQQTKVFLSAEHEKTSYGNNSPGPCAYKMTTSLGNQTSSKAMTEPQWKFGSESRLKYDYVERAAKLPGPGQYKSQDSVGIQLNSKKTTLPMYGFGTSDRDNRHKVYISQEHDKEHFGENSPGPASTGRVSALGRQSNSKKVSTPQWLFGTSKRFMYKFVKTPGPGSYD